MDLYGCFARMGYIPLSAIEWVYKRLAVTKGFFEEGKIYGTMSYLVVRYDGKEKRPPDGGRFGGMDQVGFPTGMSVFSRKASSRASRFSSWVKRQTFCLPS